MARSLMLECLINISIINMLIIVFQFLLIQPKFTVRAHSRCGTFKSVDFSFFSYSFWAIYLLFGLLFSYLYCHSGRSGNDHILFAIEHFLLYCISCLGFFSIVCFLFYFYSKQKWASVLDCRFNVSFASFDFDPSCLAVSWVFSRTHFGIVNSRKLST